MSEWSVQIVGDDGDLKYWEAAFPPYGDPVVETVDLASDGTEIHKIHILKSTRFENCIHLDQVQEIATPLLRQLNALMSVYLETEPIELGSVVHIDGLGNYTRFTAAAPPTGRDRSGFGTIEIEGRSAPLSEASPVQTGIATASRDVLDALEHYSRADNWHDLRRSYEALSIAASKKVGKTGKRALADLGVDGTDIENFQLTARSRRHHDWNRRPSKELSLQEGRQFLASIIKLILT